MKERTTAATTDLLDSLSLTLHNILQHTTTLHNTQYTLHILMFFSQLNTAKESTTAATTDLLDSLSQRDKEIEKLRRQITELQQQLLNAQNVTFAASVPSLGMISFGS